MRKDNFIVSLRPEEVYKKIKRKNKSNLVHEEKIELDNDRTITTLIYERYYFRVENRVALIIIFDNVDNKENTDIRVISTGSSKGLLLNVDWGAASSLTNGIREILSRHIL